MATPKAIALATKKKGIINAAKKVTKKVIRAAKKVAGIKEAKAKLDYLNMSPEKKIEYRRFMEIRRSADSLVLTAKAEGERKGRREGRAEIVKNMHETGSTVAQIVKSTKLPEKDVWQILGLPPKKVKKRAGESA